MWRKSVDKCNKTFLHWEFYMLTKNNTTLPDAYNLIVRFHLNRSHSDTLDATEAAFNSHNIYFIYNTHTCQLPIKILRFYHICIHSEHRMCVPFFSSLRISLCNTRIIWTCDGCQVADFHVAYMGGLKCDIQYAVKIWSNSR